MTSFYSKTSYSPSKPLLPILLLLKKNLFFFSLLGLVLLTACEEEPTNIGTKLLPNTDFNNITAIDTFTVESYTNYLDTIRSKHPKYSYLGSMHSPYFGTINGSFVTQVWLPAPWANNSRSFDSLILTLNIIEIIGENLNNELINIWEASEFMHNDSIYYSSREVPKKTLLASISIPELSENDSLYKFHLPKSFISEIMDDSLSMFLKTDALDDFRSAFKGLYFEYPQTDNNHFIKTNIIGGHTNMTLYYTDTLGASKTFGFLFNSKAAYYNSYKHNFDAADPDKIIKYLNVSTKDTISYIQGFNGVFTTLRFPGLKALKDSMPLGINKARLYLYSYVDDYVFKKELMPDQILARYKDADGRRLYLPDYRISSDFVGGKFNTLNQYYEVNIAAFVQQYLEGNIPEPEIEVFLSEFSTKNLILFGNHAEKPPRLEIVLTDL